jgi:hypothetical protein
MGGMTEAPTGARIIIFNHKREHKTEKNFIIFSLFQREKEGKKRNGTKLCEQQS